MGRTMILLILGSAPPLAAEPVGKFNYGLDLLRGHGAPRDEARGRALADEAAAEGLPIARRLQGAGYDPEEVTPDADHWKYAPLFCRFRRGPVRAARRRFRPTTIVQYR